MKKNIFLAPVCMMLIVCTNAQSTISKSTATLKKVDTTKNMSTLTNSNQTAATKNTTIKNLLPGKWVGTFTLTDTKHPENTKDFYYCLQINADGTWQELSNSGVEKGKGTYTVNSDKIAGFTKYNAETTRISGTININTLSMTGYWLDNPGLTWKLKK